MEVEEFVARARVALQPILHESGALLYSAAATLRPGEYYFLGINPGGTNGPCLDVGLPHLSRYHLSSNPDVLAWVAER